MGGVATRNRLRRLVNRIRAIPGERFAMRTYAVDIRVTTWSGAKRGQGTKTTATTSLNEGGQPPKVSWLDGEEAALGGYSPGDVKVGPITPPHPNGGTSMATLVPTVGETGELHYILTGPQPPTGGAYALKERKSDKAFRYVLILQKVGD